MQAATNNKEQSDEKHPVSQWKSPVQFQSSRSAGMD